MATHDEAVAYEAELGAQLVEQREALQGLSDAIQGLGEDAASAEHQELLEVRLTNACSRDGSLAAACGTQRRTTGTTSAIRMVQLDRSACAFSSSSNLKAHALSAPELTRHNTLPRRPPPRHLVDVGRCGLRSRAPWRSWRVRCWR